MADTEESESQWFSRFQEATEQRFSRFEEATDQRFSRFQEATDQRFSRLEAMVADLLCRSRKEDKENPEEQICKDEDLAEIETETKLSGIEDRAVENEANTKMISTMVKEESIPQFQVPISKLERGLKIHNASTVCDDSQYVVGCDELFEHQKAIIQVSQVKAKDELLMNSKNVTNNLDAHHLFDKMPLRVQSRRGHIKCHKTWRFKFKQRVATRESKSGFEVNKTHNESKEYPCLFLASNAATLGHMLFESFPLLNFAAEPPFFWMENKSEPVLTASAFERKKKKLCSKTWMFKYKVPHLDEKIFETSDQWIRRRWLVSADQETEDNKLILRSSTWVIHNGLNQYMVLLLASVAYDAQFSVGVGMNKKQLRLSLRDNRVWDPGGSLVDAATPCLLSLHFTALHFIAAILSFLKNFEVKVSPNEGDLLQETGHGLGLVHGPSEEKMGCVSSDPRRLKNKRGTMAFRFIIDHFVKLSLELPLC